MEFLFLFLFLSYYLKFSYLLCIFKFTSWNSNLIEIFDKILYVKWLNNVKQDIKAVYSLMYCR